MKIVISQPFYLPWAGLFNQIKLADIFVHYDDAQLPQGRSFCSRVQIRTKDKTGWLSVPLVSESKDLINNTLIDYSQDWREKHLNMIREAFSKTMFYKDLLEIVVKIFNMDINYLSELNIMFTEMVSKYLGFSTCFIRSSLCNVSSRSTKKLVEICRLKKATKYITGHGAKNYLNHELFEKHKIEVEYMKYNIIPYKQLYGEFTPYMTILDLIANTGPDAINYLQSTTIPWRKFINE